jgi:hypothetical protein
MEGWKEGWMDDWRENMCLKEIRDIIIPVLELI